MSDIYIIKQVTTSPSDTWGLKIYEVPSAASTDVGAVEVAPKVTSTLVQTLATSLIVCNVDRTASGYSAGEIWLYFISGDTPAVTTALFWEVAMAARETRVFNLGIPMSVGEKLWVKSRTGVATVQYDWTLTGIETTTGGGPSA